MSNAVTPEMIRILNSGDQRELRAFLTLYAKPVYDRAMAITGNESDARRVTRRVVSETALLAVKGVAVHLRFIDNSRLDLVCIIRSASLR